jgi:hypothetical protein
MFDFRCFAKGSLMIAPYEEHLEIHKRLWRRFVFLVLFLVSLTILPDVFIRQTETVTILSNDVARTCRSDRRFLGPRRHRSSGPPAGSSGLDYCGLVRSDHGSFELPETTWVPWFGPNREELYDLLTVGCQYRIVVAGPGTALKPGGGLSTQNRELRNATLVGVCEFSDMQDDG